MYCTHPNQIILKKATHFNMSLVWVRGDHPCTNLIFNFCTKISRDIYVAVNHAHPSGHFFHLFL